MSTAAPTFEATDQYDLLDEIAAVESQAARDARTAFLQACEEDAGLHEGIVSVSRVSKRLADAGIEHHRYSAFWQSFTGRDRPMRTATADDTPDPWEIRSGSESGNNGKPMKLRVWVGLPNQEARP